MPWSGCFYWFVSVLDINRKEHRDYNALFYYKLYVITFCPYTNSILFRCVGNEAHW